jgi:hypothetical protein
MFRFFIPLAFGILFLGWVLYRLLVKKDLQQNLNTLYVGGFFVGIWAVIYWLVL